LFAGTAVVAAKERQGNFMTIDKTLRVARGLIRSRSVLTRAERLTRLKEVDRWTEGQSPFGLPKVRVYKLTMKKKKKKKEEEGEAVEGAAAAATGGKAPAAAAGKAPAGAKTPAAKPAAKAPAGKPAASKAPPAKK
jgi:small basic protein (TIGR04137 family)